MDAGGIGGEDFHAEIKEKCETLRQDTLKAWEETSARVCT
jgi:hypothetical protein